MGQDFVVDFDQAQGLVGDGLGRGRDGRDSMTFVQCFFTRQNVSRHVPVIDGNTLRT